jgi:hypothetical protein
MQAIENNLFTQVSSEESAIVSGGNTDGYLEYINLAKTPASPGGLRLTTGEIQTGWDILVGVFPFPALTPVTPVEPEEVEEAVVTLLA